LTGEKGQGTGTI